MTTRFNRRDREGVLHFVTLRVREGRRAFSRDAYARAVLNQLRRQCDEFPARLIAYVAMPTHLHCIVNPRGGRLNHFLGQYKAGCTLDLCRLAEEAGDLRVLDWLYQTPDHHAQLFQDGKHSFHLYSDRLIWQKINYIHNNPTRSGLVTRANEYPYSGFCAMYPADGESVVPLDAGFWWED